MHCKAYSFINFLLSKIKNWYEYHINVLKNGVICLLTKHNTKCYNLNKEKKDKEMLSMDNIVNKVDSILTKTDLNTVPIQVTSIAKYYGFKVLEMPMDSTCSGLILSDSKNIKGLNTNKAIIVNSKDSSKRKRFTVAHELGHYFLEGQGKKCFGHRDIGDYSPREQSANNFASELLMPRNKVENFIKDYKSSIWGDIPSSFLIDAVSNVFNVSKPAAKVRLEKLKLI